MIFFMLLSDPATVLQAFLDEGFAADGKASGSFIAAEPDAVGELIAKLEESHRRSGAFARLGIYI